MGPPPASARPLMTPDLHTRPSPYRGTAQRTGVRLAKCLPRTQPDRQQLTWYCGKGTKGPCP